MLIYKCALAGIQVIIRNEAYTSKCSFIDDEDIRKHKEYKGRRIQRGLFKSAEGVLINADVNGAYNILKLYFLDKAAWTAELHRDCVEVCSAPVVFTINR